MQITRKMSVRDIMSKYYADGRNTSFNRAIYELLLGLGGSDIITIKERVQIGTGEYSISFTDGREGEAMYKFILKEDDYEEHVLLKKQNVDIISKYKQYKPRRGRQNFLDIRSFYNNSEIEELCNIYQKNMDFVLTSYQDHIKTRQQDRKTIYEDAITSSDSAVFKGPVYRGEFNLVDGEDYKVIFLSRHEYEGKCSAQNNGSRWYDSAKPKGKGKFTFGSDDFLMIFGKSVPFKKGAIVECDSWDGLKTVNSSDGSVDISVTYNEQTKTYTFEKEITKNGEELVKCYNDNSEEVDLINICSAGKNLAGVGTDGSGGSVPVSRRGETRGNSGSRGGFSGTRRGGSGLTRTPAYLTRDDDSGR